MQRQPEPELMDEAEQARAYAEADFSVDTTGRDPGRVVEFIAARLEEPS